jgi:NADPH:quinone reductase-like Zn-dependent oxidoreductase
MKAIRVHAYGGPEAMRIEELPTPVPGPGEALVRIQAASVNFIDVQKRRGELVGQAFYNRWGGGDLPVSMGSQGVGVVEALGPGAEKFKAGDRVSFWGTSYATHIAIPEMRLVRSVLKMPRRDSIRDFWRGRSRIGRIPLNLETGASFKPRPEGSDCCSARWQRFAEAA